MNSRLYLVLIGFLLSTSTFAQTLRFGKSPAQIEESRKRASLRLSFRNIKNDNEEFVFSGFFFGKPGHFITVHHEFRKNFKFDPSAIGKNYKLSMLDGAGREYNEITIEACTNANKVDICTGFVKTIKTKDYFETNGEPVQKGRAFHSIGQCNEPFGIKKGQIVKTTDNYQSAYAGAYQDEFNVRTRLLEVSLEKCPGDSGGALYDPSTGELLGMYSFYLNNHYFAIDPSELLKYQKENFGKVLWVFKDEELYLKDTCEGIRKGQRGFEMCLEMDNDPTVKIKKNYQ